jgi:DNA-binding HxlR family transcriptional regulator
VFFTLDLKTALYYISWKTCLCEGVDLSTKPVLSAELVKLVESRMKITLEGIEETLQRILMNHEVGLDDLKETMRNLEESFSLLSQKWNLQILFILFLRKTVGFNSLKRILGANSRTLSDKLKSLQESRYIERTIRQEPPLRVRYSLTAQGRNTILLALPLLYYSKAETN